MGVNFPHIVPEMLPRGRFSANVLFWVVGVVEDVHLAEVLMVARWRLPC